jgi:hypothetical protein
MVPHQYVPLSFVAQDLRGRVPVYVHPQMPSRGAYPQYLPGRGPIYVHPQMPSQGFSPQYLPERVPIYVHPQMPSPAPGPVPSPGTWNMVTPAQQYLNPQFRPIIGDSSLLSSLIAKASGVYPTSPPSTWS